MRSFTLKSILLLVLLATTTVISADIHVGELSTVQEDDVIPYRSNEVTNSDSLARLSVAIGVGLFLVALSVWVIKQLQNKRLGKSFGGQKISLLETRRITPKMSILLVEVGRKTYVLVQNSDTVVSIDAYSSKQGENEGA
ncbi:MAG: flagellar biosynthetic protein FliO [Candidatus Sedimenticola sp. (ex Thyasira tokunagai)]